VSALPPTWQRKPNEESDVNLNKKIGMKTKAEKKISKVMREYKAGSLHSGKGGPVVKNPKQAVAIALSQAKVKKK